MAEIGTGIIAFASAKAIGLSAIATAWAQATIGAAAMGVIAEKPEEASKLLVYIALPETIIILGFVVGLLLSFKIG